MSIGSNLIAARKAKGFTQEQLAERLGVSFQAVSAWERDAYLPEAGKLAALASALNISADLLLCGERRDWKLENPNFDPDHMYTWLKAKAHSLGLTQTLKALPLMKEMHNGQMRKSMVAAVPYRTHPLTLACHALAMGIVEDDVVSGLLLHDVLEDTCAAEKDLPVCERVRKAVRLVSYNTYAGRKAEIKPIYFANIAQDPLAALIKCIDRCNNLSCMPDGFSREKQARYVIDTERYVMPLLEVVKSIPQWNNAAWLLRYQLRTMLESYRRLL